MCQNVILCTVLKANSPFDVLLATKGCCGQKTCKQEVIQQLLGSKFYLILTGYPPEVDNCGHLIYYLSSVLMTKHGPFY